MTWAPYSYEDDSCTVNRTLDNPLGMPSLNPACVVKTVVGDAAAQAAAELEAVVKGWLGDGVALLVKATSTAWMSLPSPALTLGSFDNNVPSETVGFLRELTLWISAALLIAGFIIGMAKMGVTGNPEHGKEAAFGVVRYVVVWGIGVGVVSGLVVAADELAAWWIERATGDDFSAGMARLIMDTGGLAFIVIVGFAIFGLFATGLQIVLLVWRGGALVVLTGTLAWAASLATTQAGKAMFYKQIGWIVAYILYKPVAALFYAAAFKLMTVSDFRYDATQVLERITGMALMILALIALPAMIRLVAPLTAAVASGQGLGSMIAGAATVALPMGAMAVAAKSGAAGSAASGASGDAGASGGTGGSGGGGADGASGLGQGGGSGPSGPTGGGSSGDGGSTGDAGDAGSSGASGATSTGGADSTSPPESPSGGSGTRSVSSGSGSYQPPPVERPDPSLPTYNVSTPPRPQPRPSS